MAINKLTIEDKKLFFDNLSNIQEEYNRLYIEESFIKAEEYKKNKMKEYLNTNKEELLSLRDRLFA